MLTSHMCGGYLEWRIFPVAFPGLCGLQHALPVGGSTDSNHPSPAAVYARVRPMVSEQDLARSGKDVPGAAAVPGAGCCCACAYTPSTVLCIQPLRL